MLHRCFFRAAVLAATAGCVLSGRAAAFEQTRGEGGVPLRWDFSDMPLPYEIHEDFSSDFDAAMEIAEAEAAIHAGFAHWSTICGLCLEFEFDGRTDRVPTFMFGGKPEGDGYNTIGWVGSSWPYGEEAIAITTALYAVFAGEGRLFEADMELNDQHYRWTVLDLSECDNGRQSTDVENIVTHEAGHFIGLAHSTARPATMYAQSPGGECSKRSLSADDIDGAVHIYGCEDPALRCGDDDDDSSDPPEAADDEDSGCSCRQPAGPLRGPGAVGWAILLLWLGGRRRRSPA